MLSFVEYLEEKLGVKHLAPDGKRQLRKKNQEKNNRSDIIKNISNIKDILDNMGYVLMKDDWAYTMRKYKVVALSKKSKLSIPRTRHLNKAYIYQLFTLAHETGHTMQWKDNGGSDEEEHFNKFFEMGYDKTPEVKEEVEHLKTMFAEFDAWVKGKQFIPKYLLNAYLKHAKEKLSTYMKNSPEYYEEIEYLDPLMRELGY